MRGIADRDTSRSAGLSITVWNASASVPIGLYAIEQPTDFHLADLVIVRPPEQLERDLVRLKHILRF